MQNVNQASIQDHEHPGAGSISQAEAGALAGQVMAAAADVAQREAVFLELVGEFDAAGAARWWSGAATTAQWLAWACSIAPSTAREHVRVARALRQLPVITESFQRGELSYSKVRAITRLAGRHDEAGLLRLARAATADQLARTVTSYRGLTGTHAERERRTRVSWSNLPDGSIQIRATLTPEDGAIVVTALENATDEYREDARTTCPHTATAAAAAGGSAGGDTPDPIQVTMPPDQAESVAEIERRSRVQALVALGNHWLDSQPEDRSGADHTTVVIEIGAAELTETLTPAQAQNSSEEQRSASGEQRTGAPHTAPGSALRQPSKLGPSNTEPSKLGPSNTEPSNLGTSDPGTNNPAPGEPPVETPEAPAGAPRPTGTLEPIDALVAEPTHNAPAGAPHNAPAGAAKPIPDAPAGACRVRGHGGLEPETVRRLACEAGVHAIISDLHGEPLTVSRTRRFGTRAQRRALMLRDQHCQFPGCARQRRLKIHHVRHWLHGGPTNLTNLILLCQHHHTVVHEGFTRESGRREGPITITATTDGPNRWRFQRADGTTIIPEVVGLHLGQALPDPCHRDQPLDGPGRRAADKRLNHAIEEHRQHRAALQAQQDSIIEQYRGIESGNDPAACRLFPIGGGEGFSLANCVEVLFNNRRTDEDEAGHPATLAA